MMIPRPALLQGSAPVTSRARHRPRPTQGTGFPGPALPWDAPRPSGFAASGSATAASPHSGPHFFEDLCTLVMPDSTSLSTRSQAISALPHAAAFVNRLCCCPALDSAQSVAADRRISCPAQAPPGRLRPAEALRLWKAHSKCWSKKRRRRRHGVVG